MPMATATQASEPDIKVTSAASIVEDHVAM
jgi:hypothetical protein